MARSLCPTWWASTGPARTDIEGWLSRVAEFTDHQIAAFDFPLRYKLKDVCDTPNYDLRNLTDGGSVVMQRPRHAATFVDNHDMGANAIVNDKLMAYSFIMVHEGYPCVFWYDYYNNGLARPGTPNGIDALMRRTINTRAATRRCCMPTPTCTSCSGWAGRTRAPTSRGWCMC